MAHILFEDIFIVNALNTDGKKFQKVNRLSCKGVTYETDLLLDINSEIWPVKEEHRVTFVLASTLSTDGAPDDGTFKDISQEITLADQYEYVMHGRVFKYEFKGESVVEVSASFGGLLMRLTGDQRNLANIQIDQRIYCLMRKQETV